jgi:hypothetical protein
MTEHDFRERMRELELAKRPATEFEQTGARDALVAYALEWIGDVARDLDLPGAPRGVMIGRRMALVVKLGFVDVLPNAFDGADDVKPGPARFSPSLEDLIDGLIAWIADSSHLTPRAQSALGALNDAKAMLSRR